MIFLPSEQNQTKAIEALIDAHIITYWQYEIHWKLLIFKLEISSSPFSTSLILFVFWCLGNAHPYNYATSQTSARWFETTRRAIWIFRSIVSSICSLILFVNKPVHLSILFQILYINKTEDTSFDSFFCLHID